MMRLKQTSVVVGLMVLLATPLALADWVVEGLKRQN